MDFRTDVYLRLQAFHPLMAVETLEEGRVVNYLLESSRNLALREGTLLDVLVWTIRGGLGILEANTLAVKEMWAPKPSTGLNLTGAKAPEAPGVDRLVRLACNGDSEGRSYEGRMVIIIKDCLGLVTKDDQNSVSFRRMLKDCVTNIAQMAANCTIVLIDHTMPTHPHLEEDLVALRWPLPRRDEIERAFMEELDGAIDDSRRTFIEQLLAESDRPWNSTGEMCRVFSEAAQGLKMSEAMHAFLQAINTASDEDAGEDSQSSIVNMDPRHIIKSKKMLIARTGVLEYYDPAGDLTAVGGLDPLKDWLRTRRRGFSDDARDFGLPPPKAVLLVGPPGTGKSVVARTVGAEWGFPVVKLDVGNLMNSLLGSSEKNLRTALATAEAAAPCILWIDEIDKGMGGRGGETDGGTSRRIFATWLNWMSSKTAPVFVVATANDPYALPAEATRVGRFDRKFFVTFPTSDERREIFSVHISKRDRDPEDYDLNELSRVTEGYTGAEIEEIVISALYAAFEDGKDLTTEYMLRAAARIVPISKAQAEKIEPVLRWGRENATMANRREEEVAALPSVPGPSPKKKAGTRATKLGLGKIKKKR